LQIKAKTVRIHAADSKPDKQEVNGTVILPLLVFPGYDTHLTISVRVMGSGPTPSTGTGEVEKNKEIFRKKVLWCSTEVGFLFTLNNQTSK
jgi:hypothetical protein